MSGPERASAAGGGGREQAAWQEEAAGRERAAWRVPGRIEVLGKHTDYAGGNVLVGAVDRAVTASAHRIDAPAGTLRASTSQTAVASSPVTLRAGQDPDLPPGHWGRYLLTVLDRLTANFGPLPAAELTITSDLPPASGMSSSSALICASALALADLAGLPGSRLWQDNLPDRLSLAGYLAGVEAGRPWRDLPGAEGVGTQGGSEDHTGMMCGRPDTLLLAGFDPMAIRAQVPFPAGWAIVVGVSGVMAEKTGAALADYNRGPATVRAVLQRWNQATGRQDRSLAAAVGSLVGAGKQLAGARRDPATASAPELRRLLELAEPGYERERVRQFLIESLELVPDGAAAITRADASAFGEVTTRSQALAESGLRNQVPATTAMVSLAVELGAIGASAFGAGWGGSTYAVVPAGDARAFAAAWLERYQAWLAAHPKVTCRVEPATIVTRPGPAAARLPLA